MPEPSGDFRPRSVDTTQKTTATRIELARRTAERQRRFNKGVITVGLTLAVIIIAYNVIPEGMIPVLDQIRTQAAETIDLGTEIATSTENTTNEDETETPLPSLTPIATLIELNESATPTERSEPTTTQASKTPEPTTTSTTTSTAESTTQKAEEEVNEISQVIETKEKKNWGQREISITYQDGKIIAKVKSLNPKDPNPEETCKYYRVSKDSNIDGETTFLYTVGTYDEDTQTCTHVFETIKEEDSTTKSATRHKTKLWLLNLNQDRHWPDKALARRLLAFDRRGNSVNDIDPRQHQELLQWVYLEPTVESTENTTLNNRLSLQQFQEQQRRRERNTRGGIY